MMSQRSYVHMNIKCGLKEFIQLYPDLYECNLIGKFTETCYNY